MRTIKIFSLMLFSIYIAGCATPQPPVPLSGNFYEQPNARVGVDLQLPEHATFYMDGDVRLLDYAIIAAATSQLKSHFEAITLEEMEPLSDEIKALLESKGFDVSKISDPVDATKLQKFSDPDSKDTVYYAEKDMTPLSESLDVDYLLTLKVSRAGVARSYHGFIPLSDPQAVLFVHGSLVDLKTNRLLWYAGVNKSNPADGGWDEPPTFPGLTNSFYISMEQAKQEIISVLSKKPSAEQDDQLVSGLTD